MFYFTTRDFLGLVVGTASPSALAQARQKHFHLYPARIEKARQMGRASPDLLFPGTRIGVSNRVLISGLVFRSGCAGQSIGLVLLRTASQARLSRIRGIGNCLMHWPAHPGNGIPGDQRAY